MVRISASKTSQVRSRQAKWIKLDLHLSQQGVKFSDRTENAWRLICCLHFIDNMTPLNMFRIIESFPWKGPYFYPNFLGSMVNTSPLFSKCVIRAVSRKMAKNGAPPQDFSKSPLHHIWAFKFRPKALPNRSSVEDSPVCWYVLVGSSYIPDHAVTVRPPQTRWEKDYMLEALPEYGLLLYEYLELGNG